MVGECRGVSDAKVYRKDLFLAVQQQLKTAGEYEERRLRRRVDSTLNCSVCNKDTFQNSRIQLESFWRSRLCRYVPVSLCQLDAWLWTFQPPASGRPFGTRSLLGPLPSKIVFPFTIQLPQWYWDAEDERALAARWFWMLFHRFISFHLLCFSFALGLRCPSDIKY